jgi:hypothetical protein
MTTKENTTMRTRTIAVSWGPESGGWGRTRGRLALGRFAITWLPVEIDDVMRDAVNGFELCEHVDVVLQRGIPDDRKLVVLRRIVDRFGDLGPVDRSDPFVEQEGGRVEREAGPSAVKPVAFDASRPEGQVTHPSYVGRGRVLPEPSGAGYERVEFPHDRAHPGWHVLRANQLTVIPPTGSRDVGARVEHAQMGPGTIIPTPPGHREPAAGGVWVRLDHAPNDWSPRETITMLRELVDTDR